MLRAIGKNGRRSCIGESFFHVSSGRNRLSADPSESYTHRFSTEGRMNSSGAGATADVGQLLGFRSSCEAPREVFANVDSVRNRVGVKTPVSHPGGLACGSVFNGLKNKPDVRILPRNLSTASPVEASSKRCGRFLKNSEFRCEARNHARTSTHAALNKVIFRGRGHCRFLLLVKPEPAVTTSRSARFRERSPAGRPLLIARKG